LKGDIFFTIRFQVTFSLTDPDIDAGIIPFPTANNILRHQRLLDLFTLLFHSKLYSIFSNTLALESHRDQAAEASFKRR